MVRDYDTFEDTLLRLIELRSYRSATAIDPMAIEELDLTVIGLDSKPLSDHV